jgi:transposase-like protein
VVPKASPVNSDELTLSNLARHFSDEEVAWGLLERLRWPEGSTCPHCGATNNATYIAPKSGYRRTRTGNVSYRRLWQCREPECGQQFSVLVGSVMEGTKIPISKWLLAMHLMCSEKDGVSAHELHRTLKITYKSAWFMARRIRHAMEMPPLEVEMTGTVEADETYIGGKAKNMHKSKRAERITGHGAVDKVPVVALVQRSGEARSQVVRPVTRENVAETLGEHLDPTAARMMDESAVYWQLGRQVASHGRVNHSVGEYVRGHVYSNIVEDFFSQLKRSLDGTYHHVSEWHLPRYLAEFDYRYSNRKVRDGARTEKAIRQTDGKRLMYRDSLGASERGASS